MFPFDSSPRTRCTIMSWHSPSTAIGCCPACCTFNTCGQCTCITRITRLLMSLFHFRGSFLLVVFLFAFTFFRSTLLIPCPGAVHLPRSADVQRVVLSSPVVNVPVLLAFSPFFCLVLSHVLFFRDFFTTVPHSILSCIDVGSLYYHVLAQSIYNDWLTSSVISFQRM